MDENINSGLVHTHKIEYGEGKVKNIYISHCYKCMAHMLVPAKYKELDFGPYLCVSCGGEDLSEHEDHLEKEAHKLIIDKGPKYCGLRNKFLLDKLHVKLNALTNEVKEILSNWSYD